LLSPGKYSAVVNFYVTAFNPDGKLETIDHIAINQVLEINGLNFSVNPMVLVGHHVKDGIPSWTAEIEVESNDLWTVWNSDVYNNYGLLINNSSQEYQEFAGNQTLE